MKHLFTYRPKITSPNIGGYRYNFNEQEADNEVFVEVANYTAEFWQYDSRLGRRWNIDPVFKEYESPYSCFEGNPVWFTNPKGDSSVWDKKGYMIHYADIVAYLIAQFMKIWSKLERQYDENIRCFKRRVRMDSYGELQKEICM